MDAELGEARIERLLAHSEWLAQLARRLVHDPSAAEDLVQETWFAVLRAPRAKVRSERGWLATLIFNLARVRARETGSRRERERRSAAPERIDGPDELVARAESQRHLLAHVLALDEPYRGTLLARFVDGKSPAEIARASGVNESTVRTRLARALERLRARLASEQRDEPMLGLGPLVFGAGPGKSTVDAAWAGKALGAWIMGTGTKLATTAVVLLAAWFAWREFGVETPREALTVRGSGNPAPALGAPTLGPLPTPAREPVTNPVAPVASSPAPSAVAAPAALEDATLEILVTRDDVPLEGIPLRIIVDNSPGWRLRTRSAAMLIDLLDVHYVWPDDAPKSLTDSRGIATFPKLPRTRFFVGLDPSAKAKGPMVIDGQSKFSSVPERAELRLGSAQLHGHVYDELGRPRAGVGIMLSPREQDAKTHGRLTSLATSDEFGEYRIGDVWATDYVSRGGKEAFTDYDVVMELDGHFDGRGEAQQKIVALRAAQVLELDFGSSIPAPRWSGRLLNSFGEAFPGVPRIVLTNGGDTLTAQVDANGNFRQPYDPGHWRVRAFAAGCSSNGFQLGDFDLPATDFHQDLIVGGTRAAGKITCARDGQALPEGLLVGFHPKEHDYPAAFRDASSPQAGVYSIDGLEPGVWVVSVWPGALVEPVEITVGEGTRAIERDLRWIEQ